MQGEFGPKTTPLRALLFIASWRVSDSSFIVKTKRYGERGQPCRIPLSLRNLANGCPLMITEKVGDYEVPFYTVKGFR